MSFDFAGQTFGIIIIAGIMLLGLIFLIVAIIITLRAGSSSFWPSTRAKIVYSMVEQSKTQKILADGKIQTVVSIEPMIVYRYFIKQVEYTGRKITHHPVHYTPKAAQQLTHRYPRGLVVKVRYNPAKPHEAVLVTSTSWVGLLLATAGGILVAAGALMLYLFL